MNDKDLLHVLDGAGSHGFAPRGAYWIGMMEGVVKKGWATATNEGTAYKCYRLSEQGRVELERLLSDEASRPPTPSPGTA